MKSLGLEKGLDNEKVLFTSLPFCVWIWCKTM